MDRIAVTSSFLESIGYNAETKILEVAFKSGRIYHYIGVEPETYKALMSAESVGTFYSRGITGQYDSRRMMELETARGFEETSHG